MDGRLIVLQRVVEELGEGGAINNFDDRKRFQKAVYLGQVAGIDLGYRYSWYIKGPYSTALTRDYYSMASVRAAGEAAPNDKQLRPEIKQRLAALRPLFEVPNGIQLTKADWLELLASWHYLRMVNRYDDQAALAVMQNQKPLLVPYVESATQHLQFHGLLQ